MSAYSQDTAFSCEAFLANYTHPQDIAELRRCEENPTCGICLTPYGEAWPDKPAESPVSINIKGCCHTFGAACLEQYLKINFPPEKYCPICRTPWYIMLHRSITTITTGIMTLGPRAPGVTTIGPYRTQEELRALIYQVSGKLFAIEEYVKEMRASWGPEYADQYLSKERGTVYFTLAGCLGLARKFLDSIIRGTLAADLRERFQQAWIEAR